jgi:hypothetical protein
MLHTTSVAAVHHLVASNLVIGSPVLGKPTLRVFTEQRWQPWQGQHGDGIPFMIPQAMKQELRALGFSDQQLAELTPQEAQDILDATKPAPEAWKFEQGFASLRHMLVGADQEKRWQIFENITREAAGYVAKGFPKQKTVDKLLEIAEAGGLVAAHGDDAVQAVLAAAFEGVEQDRVPDDIEVPRTNGKAGRPRSKPAPAESKPKPAARSLAEVRGIFLRWFGAGYDMGTLDAVLAVAAAERLPGDPPWLLVISGPGNAKTETVQSVSDVAHAHVLSTITSEGALLSATPKKGRNKDATGGLLRKIGEHGILVVKDFTSILTIDRNIRTGVMSALREIHDGRWERNVGSDGGRSLSWIGRLVVIGACTTAWDQAHAVIATMGDRFVLIRSSSRVGRTAAGSRAIRNTGNEAVMRKEIAQAVAGLIENMSVQHSDLMLVEGEMGRILAAADIVTLARTGVETDYRGDVIDAHEPEMPTRFAKQLVQIMRGAVAIGIDRVDALKLALRCARDSVPQLRLAVLLDLNEHGDSSVREVCTRLQKPWRTIARALEALHALDLIVCRVEELDEEDRKRGRPSHFYSLTIATDAALDALNPVRECE